jgi:16S rRNA (cytidine1402-2'-O)-methyltransferase
MKLALVPTPVGNLEDITLRAIRYLKECDFILCEDTRYSSKLLQHLGISKPLMSYHQNNEHHTLNRVIQKIQSHNLTCLITDSGTPAISDPGFLLVRECIKENIEVECLPGPTAFVPALVVSGLPAEKFVFEGFLPHKKGRETRIKKIALEDKTVILYESPHRLLKTLEQLSTFCGTERECAVVREISKLHEEVFRGTLEQARLWAEQSAPKGEFVLLVSPVKD